ncbi:MAG: flagellar basal body P-ring formation protein FlgA [Alphaproteobacteria bacterium]|nr:flagellar basal body P-ring formation protein FlgA [Alphaproteobacteria bacterium]MBV8548483.1 flagellar basal body P-ring formation protein FlgA [Alphaproteobacteria bacterium]
MMTAPRRFAFALWMVCASALGSPTPCLANTVVTLHQDAELQGGTVRLSDLFVGVPPIIDRDIAQAPPPGQQATYDAQVLSKLAGNYRLDWQAENITDHVTLTSAATRIVTDDIRAALVRKAKDAGVHGEIEVQFDGHAPELILPPTQRPDFSLANFDYDPVSKRFRCEVATALSRNALPISGHFAVKRRVPVLAHHMEAGTVVANNDVDWIDVSEERLVGNVITDSDQLVGHELRRPVNDGDIVHVSDVIPPRLVTRGTIVTMKIETPMMVITSQGRSLQDGAMGDTVRVVNTQSNRTIEGTVTGQGTVTIQTAQHLAMATTPAEAAR